MPYLATLVILLGVGGVVSSCDTARSSGDSFADDRARMVERDLVDRDITDARTLRVMSAVPRHEFMPERLREMAYLDQPLPIGYDQTISQPYIVALMTQHLQLTPEDTVLEIGTGSGYQAAVLAEMARHVYSIEIVEALAENARSTLERLGYTNVTVRSGDGYRGWKEHAPFDAIIVTAAADHIPDPLIEQLKEGGRLIMPVGKTTFFQDLTLAKKVNGQITARHVSGVRFVPLTGEAQNTDALDTPSTQSAR